LRFNHRWVWDFWKKGEVKMKQLNERQLQTHVPIVGGLLIAHSILNIVLGLFAFALIMSGSVFFTELGPAVNDPEATRIFSVFNTLIALTATVIGALVIGLALPALVAGIGLLARRSWARIFGIVVSVFTLCAIPVGTLIGGYAIFVLIQDAAPGYFASPPDLRQTAPSLT
jgi:hypothetical protein